MRKIGFISTAFYLICIVGYFINIYKFFQTDFSPSYKAEIIRGIGILAPPVGIIAGYCTIKDIKESGFLFIKTTKYYV